MTKRKSIRIALLLLLPVQVQPAYCQMLYDVDSQGPLPVLEELAGPYSVADAKVIGEIPAGSKGLTPIGKTFVLENGQTLVSLRFQGQDGWVDFARLKRRWDAEWGVERLYCGGAEPFWGMDIVGDSANLRVNERTFKLSLERLRSGANRRDIRELLWRHGSERWTAFIADMPTCNDGMSDCYFPLEILISDGNSGLATGALTGCCSFVPE